MSTSIYTATAGPADPKAGTRAKIYSGLALLTPLLSFLASFGVFSAPQANALTGLATAVAGVLSAFGFGLAAKKTTEQTKNGTFDPAPEPEPPISTADQIANAIPTVLKDAADTIAAKTSDVETIKKAAADAFGQLPVVGGLAEELINGFIPGR